MRVTPLVVAMALVAAACTGDDDAGETASTPVPILSVLGEAGFDAVQLGDLAACGQGDTNACRRSGATLDAGHRDQLAGACRAGDVSACGLEEAIASASATTTRSGDACTSSDRVEDEDTLAPDRAADVDGDGREDRVRLLGRAGQRGVTVAVDLAGGATITVDIADARPAAAESASEDLDADGGHEIFVRIGHRGGFERWTLLTVDECELVRVALDGKVVVFEAGLSARGKRGIYCVDQDSNGSADALVVHDATVTPAGEFEGSSRQYRLARSRLELEFEQPLAVVSEQARFISLICGADRPEEPPG